MQHPTAPGWEWFLSASPESSHRREIKLAGSWGPPAPTPLIFPSVRTIDSRRQDLLLGYSGREAASTRSLIAKPSISRTTLRRACKGLGVNIASPLPRSRPTQPSSTRPSPQPPPTRAGAPLAAGSGNHEARRGRPRGASVSR